MGASIAHPAAPATELLKPGVVLDRAMLARLIQLGVPQVWIQDDATQDLDGAVAGQLTQARVEIFTKLKQDFGAMSRQTVSAAQIQLYRQTVVNLVLNVIANRKYAGLTDTLFGAEDLMSHATNVAYLSVLIGLDIEAYIMKERPRLAANHARDLGVLGLAGMLHDLGKSRSPRAAAAHHETRSPAPEGYDMHALLGYEMLSAARAAAPVSQAALNHHQRFDGTGWPDMAVVTRNRRTGPQSGSQIHIYTRIVSAANVLDNLLKPTSGDTVPPVAALHAFASERFEGWFDPVVRRAALRSVPPFAVGSQVRLSDSRLGVVVSPSLVEPCRPRVRLSEGKNQAAAITVDLLEFPALSIVEYLGQDVRKWTYSLPRAAPAATPAMAPAAIPAAPRRLAA